MGPDLPPLPEVATRIIGQNRIPAPKLLVWYRCPAKDCGVSEALDAYEGPPVCKTGHFDTLMVPIQLLKEDEDATTE